MARHPSRFAVGQPLVAVTATIRSDDGSPRVRLNAAYLGVLQRAGLTPVVLPPLGGDPAQVEDAVERVLGAVGGLVLTGGEDVEPARYGATRNPHVTRVSAERDATEIAAVTIARERRIPTLAICRGIQTLNVAFGGTLIQDLPTERPGPIAHDQDEPRTARTHAVQVVPGSRVAQALGTTSLVVNSAHHQAVSRLATGFVVTATAPDGVIEAVESDRLDPWWVMAVQWHPEEFVNENTAPDHGLFHAFAAAVERVMATVP